ncbi:MAG: serine hydrolase [Alphaproteobacteria bacterium]|nr:serine hydrolase [Alphaproteobacteria bacterium]
MSLTSTLDELLAGGVPARVPGIVAGVTDARRTRYLASFGRRGPDEEMVMTADTVGWIASMTKPLTCTAAMQLVETGQLDLDAAAADTVPDIAGLGVLEGFGDDGAPRIRPPRRPVTLRDLLTHTSGLVYDIWNADILRYRELTDTPGIIGCRNTSLMTPLVFDPGERWNYGIGIDWTGKMVEAASGTTLGAYLREHVFEPLGMHDTAFRITGTMRRRLARLYARDRDGTLELEPDRELPQEPEFEMGGGGLYGTVGDYLKFIRMILNRGQSGSARVLQPETVHAMSRNQIGPLRVSRLSTAMLALSNDAEFFPEVPRTWSFAFMINEEQAPTGRSAGSLAWAGLANSYFWIDPARGIGGAWLTQVLPFVDREAFPLYLAFEKSVYDSMAE